jgi:hypothetical protein
MRVPVMPDYEFKSEIIDISVHDVHGQHARLRKYLEDTSVDRWHVITVQSWDGGRYFVVWERKNA